MRRLVVGVLVVSVVIGGMSAIHLATAQEGPEATIAALETRVAELETQVSDEEEGPVATAAPIDDAQGSLFGPALADMPTGEPGTLSVVLIGNYETWLPIVIRNNTNAAWTRVDVAVSARDASGNLLATGSAINVSPTVVRAGGYAIANLTLGFAELPADTTFDFKVEAEEAEGAWSNRYDLTVVSANIIDDRMVGEIVNTSGEQITTSSEIAYACFDADGVLTEVDTGYSAQSSFAPDETGSFQIGNLRYPCVSFLVAATGFGKP